MKRHFLFHVLLVAAFALAACQPTPTSQPQTGGTTGTPPQAGGNARTLTIGFTYSKTGSLNVEGTRQLNGVQLWIQQVNDAGGIKLKDGTTIKLNAKFYDDESKTERVQSLYTKLIQDDKADFLISPYSSGLADAAAVIAAQNGKIMITAGAASDSTYKKGSTLIYQAYTPASRYLTGAADLLAKLDPNAKKIAVVHENDKFSTDVANALQAYAKQQGLNIVLFEGYDSGATDFAPFINKIAAAAPDAVMGGGHFADTSTFAKQLFDKGLDVKFIALLVAPPEPKFGELGDAAQGVVGPSQWEPLAQYSADSAKAAGLEWYGPSVADFVKAYKAAYNNEDPSYHSAGGYAAGLILQKAIENADSTDNAKVQAALDALNLLTFFGAVKFDTTKEAHGLQVGHQMVYIQWQKDSAGKLAKQVVWPEAGKSASAIYPAR